MKIIIRTDYEVIYRYKTSMSLGPYSALFSKEGLFMKLHENNDTWVIEEIKKIKTITIQFKIVRRGMFS